MIICRYVNMDYLVLSSLKSSLLETFILSYDIVCQWNKNLWEHMKTYPHSIQLNRHSELVVVFLVPKFHLPAHIEKCQREFSFNLTRGVGRTDGEAPERGWADSNRLSNSTKEMGPGSRHDTLDDHFGDWNYKKVIGLGKYTDIIVRSLLTFCLQALHYYAGPRLQSNKPTIIRWPYENTNRRWRWERMRWLAGNVKSRHGRQTTLCKIHSSPSFQVHSFVPYLYHSR